MAAPNQAVGPKSDKIWRDAVMRAVKRRETDKDPQALEKLADTLVTTALTGDVSALKEIGDRLDGKPAQAVQHQGEDGGALTVVIKRFTDAGNTAAE